jgi:predicted DNA-binding helix-hairpin-helix protein
MFVKGMAYGIAENCPKLQLDSEAVRKTNRVTGNLPGDFYDFMDGMIYTSGLLKRQDETCETICGIRPGTCYFVNEDPNGK